MSVEAINKRTIGIKLTRCVGSIAATELPPQTGSHHGELPAPYYRAMVVGILERVGEVFVAGVGRVGDEETDLGVEPYREVFKDMIGGLVKECA